MKPKFQIDGSVDLAGDCAKTPCLSICFDPMAMTTHAIQATSPTDSDRRRGARHHKNRAHVFTKRRAYALKVTLLILAVSGVTSWLIVVIFA